MNTFQKIKSVFADKAIGLLSRSSYFTERFFARNRSLLIKEHYEYPSIINNGYIHIERIVKLANELGKTDGKIIIDAGAANGIISYLSGITFQSSICCMIPSLLMTFLVGTKINVL